MVGAGLGLTAESLDQLKAWLRSCLLDAYGWGSDCESLMKYVVALVKKDRSTEELRSDCLEQLKVFFNDNTQKFVNELFECLESKAYLEPYGSKGTGERIKKESDEQADKSAGTEGLAFIVDKKPDPMMVSMANKDKEREEKPASLRERSRSRSRERSKDEERSRSPHLAPAQRRRSRSPLRRSRSPPPRRFRSRSRSRSRERYRSGRKGRSRSPPPARHRGRIAARHSRSRSRSPAAPPPPPLPLRDLRDTLTRKHNSALSGPGHLGARRERCRDFDEQGFCIQGELCPFDHGTDPVILDSTVPPPYNPTMRGGNGVPIAPVVPEYNPLEPDMRHPHQQPPHGPQDHPGVLHPHQPGHHPLAIPGAGPYASGGGVSGNWNYQPGPPVPSGGGGGGGGGPGGPGSGVPHVQRELVTIPRNNLTQVQRTVVAPPHENHNNNNSNSNNSPRGPPAARFQRGTELEVRRIPRAQNNIAKLNEYFSKFGTITNIQVNFQGCPESALISFSKHHEANGAYRSTDAVLGNRFIKLFWHNTNNNSNVSQGGLLTVLGGHQPIIHGGNCINSPVGGMHIKKRLPQQHLQLLQQQQQQHGIGGPDDVGVTPKKLAKPSPEALKKDNQADKSAQLISQKSRLYDKYVEEDKRLRERFEKSASEAEKDQIKTLMANLAKMIDSLRPKQAPGALLPEITSEKQLLDAELDLFRQMQAKQGQNPAEARQLELKLVALRHKAKILGLLDSSNVWHGRLGHKGLLVGQAATALKAVASSKAHGQLAIDKRPRVIAVLAGQLEMAGLCKHLSRHGKVANVAEEGDGDAKHFLFTFATRKDAEFAVNRGGVFRGVPLKWHWKEDLHQQLQTTKTTSAVHKELAVSEHDQQQPQQQRLVDGKAKGSTETDQAIAARGDEDVIVPSGDATVTSSASTAAAAAAAIVTTSQTSEDGQKPAGAGGDGEHLLGISSVDVTHKLLDNNSCGNVIKDADRSGLLLEDDDDAEEARSWRH